MTDGYTQIEHLGGLSHIRQAPGMYVGDTQHNEYRSALMNMAAEIIQNGADEAPHATHITVCYNSARNRLTVSDNGRGIPFGPTTIANPFDPDGPRIALDKLNTQWRKLQGDFPSYTPAMDCEIADAVVKLLDHIIGDELASYLLYECARTPGAVHVGGKVWPIACVDDIRKYLEREGDVP